MEQVCGRPLGYLKLISTERLLACAINSALWTFGLLRIRENSRTRACRKRTSEALCLFEFTIVLRDEPGYGKSKHLSELLNPQAIVRLGASYRVVDMLT